MSQELQARHDTLRQRALALTDAIEAYAANLAKTKLSVPAIFWPQHLLLRSALDEDIWNAATPDSRRNVLARHRRQGLTPRTIVAFYGSEGKWCAFDHDGRVTYLAEGEIIGWREIPQ